MIVELAQLTIVAGREAEFESVFRTAISAPAASHGYLAHELRRSIESPSRYMLRIEWATLEDHTVGFAARRPSRSGVLRWDRSSPLRRWSSILRR